MGAALTDTDDDSQGREVTIPLGPERMAAAIYRAIEPTVRDGTFCEAVVLKALTAAMLQEASRNAMAVKDEIEARGKGRAH